MSADPVALLARRFAPEGIVPGRAHVIFARNGGVGVAERVDGHLGYQLLVGDGGRRLDQEWDWSEGSPFGIELPLREVPAPPLVDKAEQISWLLAREEQYAVEVAAAWQIVNPGGGPGLRDPLKRVAPTGSNWPPSLRGSLSSGPGGGRRSQERTQQPRVSRPNGPPDQLEDSSHCRHCLRSGRALGGARERRACRT